MPRSGASPLLVALAPFFAGLVTLVAFGSIDVGSVLAATLAAALTAFVLARRRARRLERLEAFARAIGRGDLRAPLAVWAEDALGEVERALSDMRDHVGAAFRELEEAGEQTQGILRAMIEGVVVVSAPGEVMVMNQCAATLFGLNPDEDHRGRYLIELCRDPELQELVRETLAAGVPRAVREITVRGSEIRHLDVSVARIGETATAPFAFVLVFHDITELKRLETMRRDFVANVSHELRTPLTAIRGYAETLLGGALSDRRRARTFLGVIDRHSERLSRLIDDLLTLSDLELRRTPIKNEDVPVESLVDEVVEILSEKAARREVRLATDVPDGMPPLRGDPDRLHQLLMNVADNAVKYTPAGGSVTIEARMERQGPRPSIELLVRDTGIGIPASDLPRLSERFYRVDKARSRELGGTGLGLAIVKHIVQAHGGTLEISSAVNAGTIVRVTLPASEAAAA
jgi:two-component system phosphate regulon sensor histidine kinase PhoR